MTTRVGLPRRFSPLVVRSASHETLASFSVLTVFQASQGTKCHDANPSSPVKLEVVSKGALNTCAILSVHITGGQKPYTFMVAETDTIRASVNTTMGPNDDQFDFVNILRPG